MSFCGTGARRQAKQKHYAHDILKTLKAQFFDSCQRYGDFLIEYYVLLCCDSKKNKDIIRAIAKQFDKQRNVTLIEPEYTLSLRL
jgi:hypothetical protein